jgi:hypothetical protein
VTLDSFGNATAVLWTHGCIGSATVISATLDVAPNTTTSTTFDVFPPQETPEGLEPLPFRQTSIAGGGVATIVEAEVRRASDAKFEVSASNLLHRCHVNRKPYLHWIYEGKERTGGRAVRVTLDNNSNGFAVVLGGGCQVGESLITGELVYSPFTSFVTGFKVLPAEEVL